MSTTTVSSSIPTSIFQATQDVPSPTVSTTATVCELSLTAVCSIRGYFERRIQLRQATSIRAMFEIALLVSPAFRTRNCLMLQSSKMISVWLDSAQNSVHMGI